MPAEELRRRLQTERLHRDIWWCSRSICRKEPPSAWVRRKGDSVPQTVNRWPLIRTEGQNATCAHYVPQNSLKAEFGERLAKFHNQYRMEVQPRPHQETGGSQKLAPSEPGASTSCARALLHTRIDETGEVMAGTPIWSYPVWIQRSATFSRLIASCATPERGRLS